MVHGLEEFFWIGDRTMSSALTGGFFTVEPPVNPGAVYILSILMKSVLFIYLSILSILIY